MKKNNLFENLPEAGKFSQIKVSKKIFGYENVLLFHNGRVEVGAKSTPSQEINIKKLPPAILSALKGEIGTTIMCQFIHSSKIFSLLSDGSLYDGEKNMEKYTVPKTVYDGAVREVLSRYKLSDKEFAKKISPFLFY